MSRFYEALNHTDSATRPVTKQTLAPVLPLRSSDSIQPARGVIRGASNRVKVPEWALALDVLRKHWRLSALFAGLVMLTVTVVTFRMRAVYEPSARIEVDPPGETFSLEGGNGVGSDTSYVETQAQNLKSDKLAVAVIRQLHLDQNPDLVLDAKERAQNQRVG